MDRPGHDLATFFVGTEVEHTPAYGKKTLFVVGIQDYHRILEIILDSKSHPVPIEHVYFGANMSFPNLAVNNGAEWAKWEKMIFNVMEQAAIMVFEWPGSRPCSAPSRIATGMYSQAWAVPCCRSWEKSIARG